MSERDTQRASPDPDETSSGGIAKGTGSPSIDSVYGAVASRRTSFDAMLWQVPALSLAGQAFLYTIILAPDARLYSRAIACVLSVVTSAVTVHLMVNQRQAEIADAHLLAELEEDLPYGARAHGEVWKERRDRTKLPEPWMRVLALRWLATATTVWIITLLLFGAISLVSLLVVLLRPEWI